jgi:hypothetical protein
MSNSILTKEFLKAFHLLRGTRALSLINPANPLLHPTCTEPNHTPSEIFGGER